MPITRFLCVEKAISAIKSGRLSKEIEAIKIPQVKGNSIEVNQDEQES